MDVVAGPWATRPASRLVVLLSSERSGSTLLRVMLGAHSRVVAPQELFLLRYPEFDSWRRQKSVAIESLVELFFLLGRPLAEPDIDARCRGRSSVDVYRWLFEQLPPRTYLLDKTPAYTNDMATLMRSATLAPFYIWLIRHPLGVIDSHVRLKATARHRPLSRRVLDPVRDVVERWTSGMSALARERETKWVVQNLNVRNFLRQIPSDQQSVVYFEELVRAPAAVLSALCSTIGIATEPAMLLPDTQQVMNPQLGDPTFHLHERIDPAPTESWMQRYDESQLRAETQRLMRQIGVSSRRSRHSPSFAA